ncbi:MAG: restriction endonuclease subunit S [Dehalococcoidales bacterium]
MMWCNRPEFDRNAWFTTDSSVRGGFDWDDFCEMELPVPSLEKQREIVKEYRTIIDYTKLNWRINLELKKAAEAVYRRWFVDLEFPISFKDANAMGKPELEGQPFKSSGGDLIYNDVLERKIPSDWEDTSIQGISEKIVCGKTPLTSDPMNFGQDIPFVTIPDMHEKIYVVKTERSLSKKGAATQINKTLPENSICVSCIASPGIIALTSGECQTNQQINSIICNVETSPYYAYFAVSDLCHKIKEWGMKGSVGANMNKAEFSAMKILKTPSNLQQAFHEMVEPIFKYSLKIQKQQEILFSLQQLVNARMVLGI